MGPIPLVNVIAVVHLSMIFMFLGVFAAESVLELSAFMGEQSREKLFQNIRVHYWIDNLVELPVVFAVIASGIAMIFLVDKLTTLHYIKIACVAAMFISALPCAIIVNRRYHALKKGHPEDKLRQSTITMIRAVSFLMSPFLIGALCLGFYLAFFRISDLIT